VLVVEDDLRTADMLRRALQKERYAVDVEHDGPSALWAATEHPYTAIVLDAMIPEPDGFEVCRRLRSGGNWVPVLLLTARDGVGDRVCGLDAGADDYLTKPFDIQELFARLRALVRRVPVDRPPIVRVADLELDPASHTVRRNGSVIELAPRAYAVLATLARRAGEVVPRQRLLSEAWDFAFDGTPNALEAAVKRLRDALDVEGEPSHIETVRGVGYRLRVT